MKLKKIRDLNKRRKKTLTVPGKTTRTPEMINDVKLNMALINCRSVKPKLDSLAECFKMNKLSVALLNETWLYQSDPQAKKMLNDLLLEKKIAFIRKDRDSRGGGVAIAFNTSLITLTKLPLETLKNKKKYEIVAARGKLKGYKQTLTFFSCYVPPKLTKDESLEFMDLLSNAIAEAKTSGEGWFVLGGDWNNRQLELAIEMYPDIKILLTPPTRKNRILDKVASNFGDFCKTAVCYPLEGEKGQVSDHKIVLVEAMLPRPKAFSWEVHEYLQVTQSGSKKFIELMGSEEWRDVKTAWPDQNEMVELFHNKLEHFIDSCFVWKRVRRKSTDKPWISDALRARMKRRKAIFWNEGRSELWKKVDRGIKLTIAYRKRKYEENMTARLESSGKTNQWYSIYKFLASDDMPDRWNITELRPNQSAKQLANELSEHFSKITNMSGPLTDIPKSSTSSGLIPQLDNKITERLIIKAKKSNSRVTGDFPRDLVNPCSKSLAIALTPIFNACLINKEWPDRWKIETIIPIPKSPSPGGLDDIRPISMTTLWSKILESSKVHFRRN